MKNRIITTGITAAICGTTLSIANATIENRKPNILFIQTDDQSRWSVSAYGCENLKTPNIDRLAAEGALFENAFVDCPVCSPSRMTLLTGKHGTEVGVTDYLTHKQGLLSGISTNHISWPNILVQNGYTTGLIGKWHIGDSEKSLPKNNGFSYFVGNLGGGWHPKNPKFINNDNQSKTYTGYSVDVCSDLAIDFIRENREKPFALLLNYREPHAAYVPMPEQDMAAMKELDPVIPDYPGLPKTKVKNLMRDYLTAVRAVDRNVGRILEQIKELGLENDTIVIYTSDHGYNMGHHGLRFKGNGYWLVKGKKGCRPNMFDTSIIVPLLIKWPGVTTPGMRITPMVSNLDTFPSVLAMLDINMPQDLNLPGKDFTPFLKGKSIKNWRDTVFGQYQMINDARDSMRMIRTADWKLIRHYKVEDKDELYNLKSDPEELNNLYNNPEYSKKQKQLQQRLNDWMKGINDDPTSISPQRIKQKKKISK